MKTPRELIDELNKYIDEYDTYSQHYVTLKKREAEYFNSMRENFKSDTATTRMFDATDEGIKLKSCKQRLKVLEIRINGIKSNLRLLENEAKNQM